MFNAVTGAGGVIGVVCVGIFGRENPGCPFGCVVRGMLAGLSCGFWVVLEVKVGLVYEHCSCWCVFVLVSEVVVSVVVSVRGVVVHASVLVVLVVVVVLVLVYIPFVFVYCGILRLVGASVGVPLTVGCIC